MHCCTAITSGPYPLKSGIKISCATSLGFWAEVPSNWGGIKKGADLKNRGRNGEGSFDLQPY